MDIFGLFTLVGGLALFLYGMNVMGNGLEKVSGGKLERILEKLTSNPIKAVVLGAGVTAVIQSSSATTVMVVGFVNSGIMKLHQAIGIIMGANVGTTITSWLLSLTGIESKNFWVQLVKPSSFAPVLALIGIILFMAAKSDKKKNIGEILLGFAILMAGMESMSGAVKPLANVPEFTNILTMFRNPILGVLAGAFLTAVIQSSSASVGILQALSVTGGFTFASVIPIILGQNIGTCVTAMLSSVGTNRDARRTAVVHLYFNIIGSTVFLTLFYVGNMIFKFSFSDDTVGAAGIALVHSIFNIFATVILLPFIKGLEKLAYMTIPVMEDEKHTMDETFAILDERFLNSPSFAIEQCKSLVNQMGVLARDSFIEAMEVVKNPTEEKIASVIQKEEQVDLYNDKISAYLAQLKSGRISYEDGLKTTFLLHCLTDFERISDHAVNIVECAKKKVKDEAEFSRKAKEEMQVYSDALTDILQRTTESFIEEDVKLARTVEPLEGVIDKLNKEIKKHHMKRLNKGKCTPALGLILSDLAMNYERVADHCSNIAVYMMQLKDNHLEEHSFTEHLDKERAEEFAKMTEFYKEKYVI